MFSKTDYKCIKLKSLDGSDIKSIEFISSFFTIFQYFICFQNPLYLLKIATGLVIIALRNQKVSKDSTVLSSDECLFRNNFKCFQIGQEL